MNPTSRVVQFAVFFILLSLTRSGTADNGAILISDLNAKIGGGTVREWRILDQDTALLLSSSGNAVFNTSSDEIIYGDLENPDTLEIQDFSPEKGWVLKYDRNGAIEVIDAFTGRTISSHSTVNQPIEEARFFDQGDQYYVSISLDGIATVDSTTGQRSRKFDFPQSRIVNWINESKTILYSIDPQLTHTSPNYAYWEIGAIKAFDLASGEVLIDVAVESRGGHLSVNRNHILWQLPNDTLLVINMDTAELRTMNISLGDDSIRRLRIHPNGESIGVLLTPEPPSSEAPYLKLYRIDDSSEIADINQSMEVNNIIADLRDFDFSANDNQVYTFHSGFALHSWNTTQGDYNGEAISSLLLTPFSIDFSPDGKHLIAFENGFVKLINIESNQITKSFLNSSPIFNCSFSKDSRFLYTTADNGQWQVYQTSNGGLTNVSPENDGAILTAALINNGTQIAAYFESGDIVIYKSDTLEEVSKFSDINPVPGVLPIFDYSSGKFAFWFGRSVQIYNSITRRLEFETTEDFPIGIPIQISREATRIAFTNNPETLVRVYDTESNSLLVEDTFDQSEFVTTQLSQDGSKLVLLLKVIEDSLVTGHKAIIHHLNGDLPPTETPIGLFPFRISDNGNNIVLSADGSKIIALSTSASSFNQPITSINLKLLSINLSTGETTTLPFTIFSPQLTGSTRFLKPDGDRIILGESAGGDHLFIDPQSGDATRGFDFMPIDVVDVPAAPRISGTVQHIDDSSYISLGQDGVLRTWRLLTGSPINAQLSIHENGLNCDLQTHPNFRYRLMTGEKPNELELGETSTIATSERTSIPVAIPGGKPVFIKAIEFAVEE